MAATPDGRSTLLAGRYELGRALGSGGMATVFAATDTVLDRTVAVKRLRTDAAEQHAERFRREAQIGAGLNHPNLAAVYDIISEDDAVLIVMEYVDGPSLELELEQGPLDPERALGILRGLAAALDHAHEAGIVHRDVKPANVLLAPGGRAKLVDLGIATAAEQTRLTATHEVVGTLSYMPPERLSAESPGTGASDIYSLAMLALRMLAGELPWQGADVVERLRLADSGAPDTAAVWPDGPSAARAAIEQSLDPDPALRHRTAWALVDDLAESLGNESAVGERTEPIDLLATPARRTQPAPSSPASAESLWPKRPRWGARPLAAAVGAVALAAVVTAVVFLGGGEPGGDVVAGNGGGQGSASAGDGSAEGGDTTAADGAAGTDSQNSVPEVSSFAAGGPEDDARGSELNDEGFALLQNGDPARAVKVLRRSVKAFEEGTDDIDYAYALFNYGNALRLSGQAAEAIPVLEARMQIPDQTEIVQSELDAARADVAG